jgi:SAM-dependent methyltransferase
MDEQQRQATQASYDTVAAEYAACFFDELTAKPLDRALLDCFVELTADLGVVADIGCGPGHVARYLHERGAHVIGIDLSPEMVAVAQRLSPALPFQQGDMLALTLAEGSLGAIAAFYSIIHVPPDEAFRSFARVLRSGGLLLVAFHVGEERVHRDEWWQQPVSLDFQFYQPAHLIALMEAAGFKVEMQLERAPYPAEHPSQRGYLLARRMPF